MEVRGDIGWYNPGTDEYTIWMSSQTPHIQRLLLTAFVTGIPEHKIRCISPDVGGAFGTKIFCYADMRAGACSPARRSAAGRSSGSRAGARTTRARSTAATTSPTSRSPASATARSPGCGSRRCANLGGRLSTIGPGIPTTLYARVLSGCYKIPNVYAEVTGVYTNTTFVDAYRGAGRPEATYVVERAMDLFAAEIGMDRAELRRRNFIAARTSSRTRTRPASGPPRAAPRSTSTRATTSRRSTRRSRWPATTAWPRPKAEAEGARQAPRHRPVDLHRGLRRRALEVDRRGRRGLGRGDVGVGQHQDPPDRQDRRHDGHPAAGPGPRDDLRPGRSPRARHPDGGHRRPALGHPGDAVRLRLVRQPHVVGRDDRGDQGGRQDPREGAPVSRRTCSRPRVDDIEIDGANYFVKGSPDRVKTIQEIAFALDLAFDPPEGMEPYLDETAYYDTPNCTWPFGTHIAIVEIDEETGTSSSSATSRSTTSARRSTR